MSVLRVVGVYALAVAAMAVLGAAVQSAFVLASLSDVGAEIGAGAALAMMGADIVGLGPLYGVFIAIGFLIAFLVAALAGRWLPAPRTLVFIAAGAVCMAVMLTAMREVFFDVQLIAGARSLPGFLAQAAVGGACGALFAALTPAPNKRRA